MRTIVITGGTGDLGHAVVPRLAREYRCVALYRSDARWRELQESANAGENLIGAPGLDSIAAYAPIHALVHLAGGFAPGSSAVDATLMLDINFTPFVQTFQAVQPHLADGGRIVAISSAASTTYRKGLAAYVASKAALNAYVLTLAKDLADRNVTANVLLPTTLDTPANRESMPKAKMVPLATVAETIAFLLGDAGASVTGQLITLS